MPLAPVAVFVYNRLSHAQRTLEALGRNPLAAETDLTIYSDGPKREADREKVIRIREYLKTVSGFRKVTVVEREANMGLARSIIAGVTETVHREGKVIVLEDDMVTSPHFLKYMNDSLDMYEAEEKVISVAAYIYPVASKLPTTFFLRGADCWGWGTWKRGWDHFEPDGRKLLDALEKGGQTRAFDFGGTFPYTRMLRNQIEGRNDSWAIRWYASAFLKEKLTLYPGISLLQNIGNDGEGTHCSDTDSFDVEVARSQVELKRLPPMADPDAAMAVEKHFRSTRKSFPALLKRAWEKVSRLG